MQTKIFTPTLRKAFLPALSLLFLTLLVFTTPSCYVGTDGRPGLAYVAFDWEVEQPEYIDCGTSAVPPQFYYGTNYRINPGWYHCYYDGKVWNGTAWGSYAWEMDYEIWVNPGQKGGYGFNGRDGMNTYLNFVCSPYGPKLFRRDDYLRKAKEVPVRSTEITPEDEQVSTYDLGEYTVKMTIRKVAPRTHTDKGNLALN